MHVPPRDRQVLKAWARGAPARAGLAQRALIVLLAADGAGTSEIVAQTGASKPTVIEWKKRYAVEGLGGLQDRSKPGRPRRTDDAAIVLATLQPPPDRLGVTHWSSRLLASELGMSNVKVAETWREYGLQPWRREPVRFATDPQLGAKSRQVTGLYLNPPVLAVLLCAADELPGKRAAHERSMPGASGLLAALAGDDQPATDAGELASDTSYPRRRHHEFLHFLQQAAAACAGAGLHVLALENYATRRHPEVRAWLARHPQIKLHFTPTRRSWLTMTEVFAALSTGASAADIGSAIGAVLDSWHDRCRPFAWTKPAGEDCTCRIAGGDVSSPANPVELP